MMAGYGHTFGTRYRVDGLENDLQSWCIENAARFLSASSITAWRWECCGLASPVCCATFPTPGKPTQC
jgi:hypothetical protein